MTKTFADYGIHIIDSPRSDGEVRAICPVCTPSRKREHQREKDLTINVTKGTWECKHVGCTFKGGLASGTIGTIFRKVPVPLKKSEPNAQQKMYAYFAERGITQDVVDRAKITANGNVISFPYFLNGQHVHTSFRTFPDKKFWQDSESDRTFYGMDNVIEDDTSLIIVEGQLDQLSFAVAGYPNCISIPDGGVEEGKATDKKFEYLKDALPLFKRMKRIYLACDNDAVGRATNEELARRIGREKCWMVKFPFWLKDANDALTKATPAYLAELIETARPYPVEGIFDIDQLHDEFMLRYTETEDQGMRTLLYPTLDAHYRPRAGLLTVITGIPGHGKSLWLDHIISAYVQRGWRIGIYSPENHPPTRHMQNLAEAMMSKPFRLEYPGAMSKQEIEDKVVPFLRNFKFILPAKPDIHTILEKAHISVFQEGLNGLVLDPWNTIEQSCPSGMSPTQYVAEVIGAIKRFAYETGVHVWLVAHPTKMGKGGAFRSEDDPEPKPTMYDISTSANFYNMADYGITIWRDKKDRTAPSRCIIQKIRYEETGKEGTVYFKMDRTNKRMMEAQGK